MGSFSQAFADFGHRDGSGYVHHKTLYKGRLGYLDSYILLDRMTEFGVVRFTGHIDSRKSELVRTAKAALTALVESGYQMSTWTAFHEATVRRAHVWGGYGEVGIGNNLYLCFSSAADVLALKAHWPADSEFPCPEFRERKKK